MKNKLKNLKWLRWVAATVFGVMLVLNVMVSLEFSKDKTIPSLTLAELGNQAFAQGGETSIKCIRCLDQLLNRYECKPNGTGLMTCPAISVGTECCGNLN